MNAHPRRTPSRRRHAATFVITLAASLVAVCGLSYSRAQGPAKVEREIVEKIPKHLPIKVKVKKPERLKDAGNEDWLGELELEVTNTGTKPIYYLHISVFMPDVFAPNGRNYGYGFEYGRGALISFGEPVRADDVPIQPGGVVVLSVPADEAESWKDGRAKGEMTNPKRLEFIFNYLNFGDRTGFVGSDGRPIPERKERSSKASCAGDGNGAREVASVAYQPPRSYFPDIASLATYLPPPRKVEREVVEKIPKHLPIKVKVKKPERLKDAGNEDWLGELELEVTNTGAKPIYFLDIVLDLPDVLASNGLNIAWVLRYGRGALISFGEPVRADDVPIQPGGVVVLSVPAPRVEDWKRAKAKGMLTNPKKIEIFFQQINFGDGTGFVGTGGSPIPERKERGANPTCPRGDNPRMAVSVTGAPRYKFP